MSPWMHFFVSNKHGWISLCSNLNNLRLQIYGDSGKVCGKFASKDLQMFKHSVWGWRTRPDVLRRSVSEILEGNRFSNGVPTLSWGSAFSLLPSVSFLLLLTGLGFFLFLGYFPSFLLRSLRHRQVAFSQPAQRGVSGSPPVAWAWGGLLDLG